MSPELKDIARKIAKTAFHLEIQAGHVANGRDRGHVAEMHSHAKQMRSLLGTYFALHKEHEDKDQSTQDTR